MTKKVIHARVALHRIIRGVPGGKPGEQEEIAPGTVFVVHGDAELKEYSDLDAVREPTEAELMLFERAQAQSAAPIDDGDDEDPEPSLEPQLEPQLEPKHLRFGKFVVVDQGGKVVSGEGVEFDGKDSALAWIAANPDAGKATESLVG